MPSHSPDGPDDEHNPFVAFKKQIDSVFQTMQDNGTKTPFFAALEGNLQTAFKKFGDSYERATNPERKQLEGKEELVRTRPGPVQRIPSPEQDDSELWDALVTNYARFSPYAPRNLEEEDTEASRSPWHRMRWQRAYDDLVAEAAAEEKLAEAPAPAGRRRRCRRGRRHRRQEEDAQKGPSHDADAPQESNTGLCPAGAWWLEHEDFNGTQAGPWDGSMKPFDSLTDDLGRRRRLDEMLQGRSEQHYYETLTQAQAEAENTYMAEGAAEHRVPATELDLYEHFVGLGAKRGAVSPLAFLLREAEREIEPWQGSEAAPQQQTIISRLTTTRSVTRPDGTVETHRVLKRRFADGREETDEELHVTPASAWPAVRHNDEAGEPGAGMIGQNQLLELQKRLQTKHAQQAQQKQKPQKGSGWFWSS